MKIIWRAEEGAGCQKSFPAFTQKTSLPISVLLASSFHDKSTPVDPTCWLLEEGSNILSSATLPFKIILEVTRNFLIIRSDAEVEDGRPIGLQLAFSATSIATVIK